MKDMKKFYFLILGIVLCGMVAQAQNSYEGHIGFGQHHVVRKGGELNVEVSLDLGAVNRSCDLQKEKNNSN